MFRFQSGPRLAAGFKLTPLPRFAEAATVPCAVLCMMVSLLPASVAAQAQSQAQAQAQAPSAREASNLRLDPLSAQANIPPLVHESAFTQYRRFTDVPVGSWRDANETVNRIGGWRAYAREAAQPASPAAPLAALPSSSTPASSVSAPSVKPAEPTKVRPMPAGKDPHAGHKMN